MTNIDRAAEIMREADTKSASDPDINRYCYPSEYAQALADAGLLMPAPTIIRTVEELEALDPDTLLTTPDKACAWTAGSLFGTDLPAATVAIAEQVRAARKALEEA